MAGLIFKCLLFILTQPSFCAPPRPSSTLEFSQKFSDAEAEASFRQGQSSTHNAPVSPSDHTYLFASIFLAGFVAVMISSLTRIDGFLWDWFNCIRLCGEDRDAASSKLVRAAESGDLEYIQILLSNTNERDAENMDMALICASHKGYLDIVKNLISAQANVNASNTLGSTALHHACYKGNLNVVRFLAIHGRADITSANRFGDTVLHRAASQGHLDIIKFLHKECKANVQVRNNSGDTLLLRASHHGHVKVVEYLLETAKVSPLEKDSRKNSALHWAARSQNKKHSLEVVKCLLHHKANIAERDEFGATPLHDAASNYNFGVVQYLIALKADPEVSDSKGTRASEVIDKLRRKISICDKTILSHIAND